MQMKDVIQLLVFLTNLTTSAALLPQDEPRQNVEQHSSETESKQAMDFSFLEPYQYNICNGLTNQLLIHAGHIAQAVKQKRAVEIPDHFIVNGVQTSDANVLPTLENSVPFASVFDATGILQVIKGLGIEARFVSVVDKKIPCQGMGSLEGADPETVLRILKAFQPSEHMQTMVNTVQEKFGPRSAANGICVHHRDGQDWHEHCKRWSSIPDDVYRGNCLGVPNRNFLQSLQDRGLTKQNWIYYCGDHDIPSSLTNAKYDVVSRQRLLQPDEVKAIQDKFSGKDIRDLWGLIDFFVCGQLPQFIGNSVSTFSAVQIALKDGEGTFWYNSQSIPLSDLLHVYQIPIVYTYTERSKSSGKHMLQVSITSVLTHMPRSKIHVLYNGNQDSEFREWLTERGVILHAHEPEWQDIIEEIRMNGNHNASHLFAHAGNYLGTWQRIDIPLHIKTEYCLLLDSDTLVTRPFTLADFGMKLTYSIAMSNEYSIKDKFPSNAGVMLMNVPYLKHTYPRFLTFIKEHATKLDSPSPSDQGAYLDFYNKRIKFLSPRFNFKPYWKEGDNGIIDPFILHFHGAKPHDYLKYLLGQDCDPAIQFLCKQAPDCHPIQLFARASKKVDPSSYCDSAFSQEEAANFCNNILDALVESDEACHDLSGFVWQELHRLSADHQLPIGFADEQIRLQQVRKTEQSAMMIWSIVAWCLLAVATAQWKGKRSEAIITGLVLAWAFITFLIHIGVIF